MPDDTAVLLARIRNLEDMAEIARVKAAYCSACDDDHDAEQVCALFIPEGRWEAPGKFVLEGRDAIRSYFDGIRRGGKIATSSHMIGNADIRVDGDRGWGSWRLLMLYGGPTAAGEKGFFRIIAHYRDDFVRTAQGWRIGILRTVSIAHDEYSCGEARFVPPAAR